MAYQIVLEQYNIHATAASEVQVCTTTCNICTNSTNEKIITTNSITSKTANSMSSKMEPEGGLLATDDGACDENNSTYDKNAKGSGSAAVPSAQVVDSQSATSMTDKQTRTSKMNSVKHKQIASEVFR